MQSVEATLEHLLAEKALEAYRKPPENLFPAAGRLIADFAGVTIAGIGEGPVRRMAETLERNPGSNQGARVLGSGEYMSLRSAATLNGMAGHFHDYDDDDPAVTIAHPSVTVLSAIFAIADQFDVTGAEFTAAYLAGIETMTRVALTCNPTHYNGGWHATASLGIFGATAASGALLRLGTTELAHAIGIAASLASGVKGNFGSDMKPIQVGQAAGNAVWAAQLAKGGLKATPGALFGKAGFIAASGVTVEGGERTISEFGVPHCLIEPGINIKLYPCCSSAHTSMDAIIALVEENGLDVKNIAKIDVWVGRDAPAMLIFEVPTSGLQGKFSLRYCVTVAALTAGPSLVDYTDEAIAGPEVASLIRRTFTHIDENFEPCGQHGVTHQARARIEMASGETYEKLIMLPLGSATRPLSDDKLRRKFMTCAAPSLGEDRAAAAFEVLTNIRSALSSRKVVGALLGS